MYYAQKNRKEALCVNLIFIFLHKKFSHKATNGTKEHEGENYVFHIIKRNISKANKNQINKGLYLCNGGEIIPNVRDVSPTFAQSPIGSKCSITSRLPTMKSYRK